MRLTLGRAGVIAELNREGSKRRDVDRDPDALHAGEHALQRQFHLGQQPAGTAGLHLRIENGAQLADRRRLGRQVLFASVEGQLPALPRCDRAAEVALAQSREIPRPLPRLHEVGGQRRVCSDTPQVHPLGPQRQ